MNEGFARDTARVAAGLGFSSCEVKVGDLSDFDRLLPDGARFDFITLTNTVHEVAPGSLAALFLHSILRLTDTGTLFIYDMERVVPPELGAIPWAKDDVRRVVTAMLHSLGADDYRPEVGRWNHRTCDGWNVQIERKHIHVSSADIGAVTGATLTATSDEIISVLAQRMVRCRAALEKLTQYGSETAAESDEREYLLFEFWALSRALESGV